MDELLLTPENMLTIEQLVTAARDPQVRIDVPNESRNKLRACREGVEKIVDGYKHARTKLKGEEREKALKELMRYGITTGFGEFKDKAIHPDHLEELQRKILLSHATGVGFNPNKFDPQNYFPGEVVRASLILRVQTFIKGHSGVRETILEALLWMLNAGIVPLVPVRGSVGSSGDLAPLSHLFATLLGEGSYYVAKSAEELQAGLSPVATGNDGQLSAPSVYSASQMVSELKAFFDDFEKQRSGFELTDRDFSPKEKEGLALTNGATFSAAWLAFGVHEAEILADTADAAVSLTLESICGNRKAFDHRVHDARGHEGQATSAANIDRLTKDSHFVGKVDEVQDVYSVRCAPAVHGITRDTIGFVQRVVTNEINAATDNPLVFEERNDEYNLTHNVYSAGNFHGQPVGVAADFLAIAVAELANISERRIQMLLDANHSRHLPGNLIAHPGVNSGFMIAQYTAASLVSENKINCHPSSVDSIPTSANSEDHVAMATTAARKLQPVLGATRSVLAIELMVAAQAVEWRSLPADGGKPQEKQFGIDPNKNPESGSNKKDDGDPDSKAMARQSQFAEHFQATGDNCAGPSSSVVMASLGNKTKLIYDEVRATVPALVTDVFLEPLVEEAIAVVQSGKIAAIVREP